MLLPTDIYPTVPVQLVVVSVPYVHLTRKDPLTTSRARPVLRPFLRRDLAEIREGSSIALVEISEHDMVTVERIPVRIKDEMYYYFYTISWYFC